MSSRSRNFRRRSDSDDAVTGDDKPTVAAPKPAARPKPKLLSFADDEEEQLDPPVRVRPSKPLPTSKPSSIHKLTSTKDRAAAPVFPSNVQPQTGEYTKEKLRELQKNARSLGSSVPKQEPVVVLKGLVKPVVEKKDEREEDEEARREKEARRFAKLGIDGKDSGGLIPDQATIDAIRAKRERLRQSRVAPDYISLDSGGVVSARSAGGSSDDEESDFRGRMSLLGDGKEGGGFKGVFEVVEERDAVVEAKEVDGKSRVVVEEEEEDEEERIWEEEQFRKGLGKRLDDALSAHVGATPIPAIAPSYPTLPPVYPQQVLFGGASQGSGIGVSRSAEVLSITEQAAVATRALKENISKLKETHGRTVSSLVKTEDNLLEGLSNITDLEKSLEAASKKFVYMQELRNFVSVMCDFLQDKSPYIEELEEQMQKLHEDRASAILERRALDFADESAEIEAAVNAAMSVLSKGSGSAYVSAATTAAQAASAAAKESANLPVELDEFGRDMNLQKRMDSARRAESRKRRRHRSESKRISMGNDNEGYLIEGECSTDESDSESKAYISNQDELLQTADQIFCDAADEYSNLSVVKEKLEDWKRQFHSSYRDAYMSLTAPDIFSPYVRLELLKWDPLYQDIDFNDMKWHMELFDYGMRENESDFDPDDPDANLIPELVEKVALPILHHEIAHCWDIFSTKRTKNAVSAIKLVINYIPSSSETLRDLLSVIHTCLSEAVNNLVVPTWSTTVMKIVPDAAQIAAYQFGMSVRLLRNICLWKNILAQPVLEEIALDKLIGGKIMPHLHSTMPNVHDALTRTERVVASLSGVWSGPKGENSQRLQPLVNCVSELGRKLEKRHVSVGGDVTGLARRLKKILVDLNEYDKARAILRTFQIKEAL